MKRRNLFIVLSTLSCLLGFVTVGFAQPRGPSWDRGSAQISAHELSEETIRLQRVLQRMSGYSELSEDARDLSRSAEMFRRQVERGASRQQLHSAFVEVQDDYLDMRSEIVDMHRRDPQPSVTRAWANVAFRFEMLALTTGISSRFLCEEPRGYQRGAPYDDRWREP